MFLDITLSFVLRVRENPGFSINIEGDKASNLSNWKHLSEHNFEQFKKFTNRGINYYPKTSVH